MFVLRNAWAALMRHKLRSLLTLLIALVAAFGTLFGWSVQQANVTATTTDRDALAPAAIVRMKADQQAKYNGADPTWAENYLSTETYNDYYTVATENSIQLANINASSSFPVRQTKDSIQAIAGTADEDVSKTGGELTLKSFTSVETARDNDLGRYTVVEGKHLSYSGSAPKGALISKALAEKNKLKVGDEFTIASPADASKTTTLTVRGIYEYVDATAPTGHGSDAKLSKDNRDNAIYIAYATMYDLGWGNEKASDWSKPNLSYVFEFSSMSDYEKFASKVTSKIDKKYELSSPTITAYEKKTAPLTALDARMGVGVVAVPAVGGVLLLALVLLAVVHRREELGFALASGVTRGRMAWQFMLETFLPIALGFAIGLLAAGFGSGPLGSALASGYATPVTGALVWRSVWVSLGALIVLMIVAGLRAAFFRTPTLFAARDGWTVASDDAAVAHDTEDAGSATGSATDDNDHDDHDDAQDVQEAKA